MDCNKDEAIRAKEIAERKITQKDYLGAKKFALKAKSLYPHLDGLAQVLSTIDVYISAENKIVGEADWYSILDVDPLADDETMRKQYRKLALMLHPDKNKCSGADGAFKLVSQSWSLLSDKAKRLAYNHKRSMRGVQQELSNKTGVPSQKRNGYGVRNHRNGAAVNVRAKATGTHVEPSSFSSSYPGSGTFWTVCSRCSTQHEYQRAYQNHAVVCPNCNEAFLAMEKIYPPYFRKSSNGFTSHKKNQKRHEATARNPYDRSGHCNASKNPSFRWDSFSETTGVNGNASAQAASVVQQAQQRVKRGLEESQEWNGSRRMPSHPLKAERPFKKPSSENFHSKDSLSNSVAHQTAMGMRKGVHFSSDYVRANHDASRMLTAFEVRKALKSKGRAIIRKELTYWILEGNEKSSKKSTDGNGPKRNKEPAMAEKISGDSNVENHEPVVVINVPDSDFHNFDLDRSESSFANDQVWAAYDDEDEMPRFYARIQKVISLDPFKIRISWLNSKSCSEFGSLDWLSSGFAKTCGDFRTGKYESSDTLNSFSHRVNFTKGTRGVIQILPKKGDVWALYRNWSADWDENTPDEVIHKYEMVEVLDDFTHEQGVNVIPLVKMAGFVAIFCASTDQNGVRRIPKEEMFRFSHQVPSYVLTGKEADNAPEGCRELDPAATPLELLKVNTEELKETSEKEIEKPDSSKESKRDL